MRESEEMQELLQPTKKRGVKSKPPTTAASNQNEEADERDEENRFGVGASTVVNTMELPNFQIDQATSLLQVKLRNWSTTKTSTARIGNRGSTHHFFEQISA